MITRAVKQRCFTCDLRRRCGCAAGSANFFLLNTDIVIDHYIVSLWITVVSMYYSDLYYIDLYYSYYITDTTVRYLWFRISVLQHIV